MSLPDLTRDGWRLEDGEAAAGKGGLVLPHPNVRAGLEPGDLAQLMFVIAEGGPPARLWVLVRSATEHSYIGQLEGDAGDSPLAAGTEVAFEPRHVIDVRPSDADSRRRAKGDIGGLWPIA